MTITAVCDCGALVITTVQVWPGSPGDASAVVDLDIVGSAFCEDCAMDCTGPILRRALEVTSAH